MSKLKWFTVALRVTLEAAIIAALAEWGYHAGPGTAGKLVLALAAPAVGFGVWGAVDFRQAGRFAEALRLLQELAISGLAAAAWYAAGQRAAAAALAIVSLACHGLVYLGGGRLLKTPPAPRRGGRPASPATRTSLPAIAGPARDGGLR